MKHTAIALAVALLAAAPSFAQDAATAAPATAEPAAAPAATEPAPAATEPAAATEPVPETAATDPAPAATPPPAPAPTATSEVMRLAASNALILDFAAANSRAIAVGERGQILLSESRTDWRQAENVPTRANLTAVSAVGDKAWAVGHDGTILHSADGGVTWAVQRSDPWHKQPDDAEFNPRQGVPLLDILMIDENNGFAIGAYSLMLHTVDGGTTWTPMEINTGAAGEPLAAEPEPAADAAAAEDGAAAPEGNEEDWSFSDEDLQLEEETDPHLNAIARTGDGSLFIVAERGAGYRSRDNGATWERQQLPYKGSMFGVIGYEQQHLLAFGMRGNAFESTDLGTTWQPVQTGTELSLMGGAPLEGGGAVLVGANGVVLHRAAFGQPFRLLTFQTAAQETPVLSSVLAQSGTALVVGGEKGVGQFQVPAAQ
jgi:photosystem II stability/assembly factor-like uncharacterized protein